VPSCTARRARLAYHRAKTAIHVVFISGFARDAARHPSGDGFLEKPFTVESLTDIVGHALDAP
jgi:FixJ family two-component response regulator